MAMNGPMAEAIVTPSGKEPMPGPMRLSGTSAATTVLAAVEVVPNERPCRKRTTMKTSSVGASS